MSDWDSDTGQRNSDEASLQDELEEIFEERLWRLQAIKIVVFGVLGLIVAVVLVRSIPAPNFRAHALTIGEEARIGFTCMVAVDEDALSKMTDLEVVNDDVGLNLLEREGRIFVLDRGTRILVVDTRFTTVMVRALEGRNEGKTGWIQSGRLRP